jgi:ABC-type nitrate/sulfonate/bicarbonate transport system permease component
VTELERPSRFVTERGMLIAVVAVLLAGWEWGSRTGLVSMLFFPAPSAIFSAFVRTAADGTLLTHVVAALRRVFAGMVIGAGPGLLAGLYLGWSPRLRATIDPVIAFLHPLPKIAVLPLVMIVFGIGEASKVVVVALGTFFPMLIAVMAGVRQIHPETFEAAEAYGANRRQVFAHVVVPGSLPLVLTGIRLSFNIGLLLTVAVELASAQEGLGKMIWLAWQTMRTENLYDALFVLALLGAGFNAVLAAVGHRLTPWHVERER